jgi:hypothetical protein
MEGGNGAGIRAFVIVSVVWCRSVFVTRRGDEREENVNRPIERAEKEKQNRTWKIRIKKEAMDFAPRSLVLIRRVCTCGEIVSPPAHIHSLYEEEEKKICIETSSWV